MKKKLNWTMIRSHIEEAREQLEAIEARIEAQENLSEVALAVQLEHAFHHLSFAWNIRHVRSRDLRNISDKDFNRWSKFPKKFKPSKV